MIHAKRAKSLILSEDERQEKFVNILAVKHTDENCFINMFYYTLKLYHELKSGKTGMPFTKPQGHVILVMFKNSAVRN